MTDNVKNIKRHVNTDNVKSDSHKSDCFHTFALRLFNVQWSLSWLLFDFIPPLWFRIQSNEQCQWKMSQQSNEFSSK